MPPSPANISRMRSESLDPYIAYNNIKSKRQLISKFKKESDPSSLEYWLPEYEDVSDDLFEDGMFNSQEFISNFTYQDEKPIEESDTIFSNYNRLKTFMTQNQM